MANKDERLIPQCIKIEPSLINRRINNNVIKVKNESPEIKSLLSLAVQTSKPNK